MIHKLQPEKKLRINMLVLFQNEENWLLKNLDISNFEIRVKYLREG